MAIQTYRDPKTGKIVLETGEHVQSMEDYTRRVNAGEISGQPKDISAMPSISRTADGGIMTAKSASSMGKFQDQTKFLGAVKDIIQRKQKIQQPLTEEKAYWRTLQRDVTPFGGERAPDAQIPGSFEDERLRELSPADQASVRSSRYGAAQSHLQGIREEEEYRGTRMEDIMGEITAAKTAGDKAKTDLQLAEARRLEILAKKKAFGYEPSAEDVFGSYVDADALRVGNKQGGTAAWRNNNPGNIKYKYGNGQVSGFAQSLMDAGIEIKEGSPATDGGSFISFPTVEQGDVALKQLLTSEAYSNLSVDEAMKKWSGGGYGSEVMTRPVSARMSDLNEKQIADLISGMKKREGWKEGKILKATEEVDGIELSDTQKKDILKANRMTESDLKEFGDMTYDDWTMLEDIGRETTFEAAIEEANSLKKDGKTPDETKATLIQKFGDVLNTTEISSVLNEVGVESIGGMFSQLQWK